MNGRIFNSFNDLAGAPSHGAVTCGQRCAVKSHMSMFNDETDTENMVDVSYANPEIEAECTQGSPTFGKGVPENKEVLEKRLKELERAISLEERKGKRELCGLRDKKGNYHSLEDDREGQLSCALYDGWRLIFVPNHEPPPLDENGKLDWSKVTAIEIQEIIDYHT